MSGEPSPSYPRPGGAGVLLNRAQVPAESRDSAPWLITFTDLVALLLAFFVMLFAMSKVDLRKWQNLTEALARSLNSVSAEATVAPHHGLDVEVAELTTGQDLDYLAGVMRQQLSADSSVVTGEIRRSADGLVVTLPAGAVAAEAGAAVDNRALFQLAGVLRQVRNRIEVVAYAGADETAGTKLSPWALALRRALAAAEQLRASGYERDVIVRGRLIDPLRTETPAGLPAGRGAAGGRVDLVVRLDGTEEP